MPDGRTFSNASAVAICGLIVFALDCCPWYGYSVWGWPASAAFAGHAAICAPLILWTMRSVHCREDLRLPMMLTVSTVALGPVGAAGSLAALVLARFWMAHALPFEEWYRALFPDNFEAANVRLARLAVEQTERLSASTTAFSDLLAFGNTQQKQDLISLISRQFRPAFGPVLKQALKDDEGAIRVQAATAMSRLENTILARTLELSRRIRENPSDTEALRDLAQHYDDCLYCGIFDRKREEDLIVEAEAAYRDYLTVAPGDLDMEVAAGRILLRAGKAQEASDCFANAIDRDFTRPQAAMWYLDSLFRLGKFAEIRSLTQDWAARFELPNHYPAAAHEALRLWTEATSDFPADARECS